VSAAPLNVGLLGLGTVGAGVAELLGDGDALAAASGARLCLARAADVVPERAAACGIPADRFTTDARAVIADDGVDVVVELIGGTGIARELAAAALAAGKHVVTANKALLAEHGEELFGAAREAGVSISFEASVCGGIPVIQAVRDGLVANRIEHLLGIVNGTSNYILTRMARENMSYADALAEAQANGYAEADPTLDVNGTDSAHKLAILAAIAFGRPVDLADVYVEGIDRVALADIRYAEGMGYAVKLLAIGKATDGGLELRVHPAMIHRDHPLAAVQGVFNAVWIRGHAVGDTMFYGRGAGRAPTASAVVADLVDLALGRAPAAFQHLAARIADAPAARARRIGDIDTRYYLRVQALDLPGVLAQVATILGNHGISIASMLQQERREGEAVPVILMTHTARESRVQDAIAAIDALEVVHDRTLCIRVEESEE